MHLAILMTNTDESAFAAAHPRDGEKFIALLAPLRPDWQFSVFSVKDGIFPDDITQFDGAIITGSPASVHDEVAWIDSLFALIRQAYAQSVPLFGACFGHQAIAMALGGNVGRNPGDWVLGRVDTVLTLPWSGQEKALSLCAAHLEQVTDLPPGAVSMGQSPGCAIAAFACGPGILTTQYHPEMTHDFVTALVEELKEKLPPDVIAKARASLQRPADTKAIAQIITDYFELFTPRPPKDPSP